MSNKIIIVTKHASAVRWLSNQGIHGKIVHHAEPRDVKGKIVVGNPPYYIAAHAILAGIIVFKSLPFSLRSQELTLEDMERAGARIRWFSVTEVPAPNLETDHELVKRS